MKILCLTTSFPRFPGDLSGVFVFHSMHTLAKQEKLKITVIAPGGAQLAGHETWDDLDIFRFTYFWPPSQQKLAYQFTGLLKTIKNSFVAKINLPFFLLCFFFRGFLHARKADVIHAQWIPTGLIGLALARIFRKPLVITARGADMRMAKGKGLGYRLNHWICSQADAVTSVNETFLDFIPGKIRYLPNGVLQDVFKPLGRAESVVAIRQCSSPELKRFSFPENVTTFLAIGHFSEVKGFDVLVKAFSQLKERHASPVQLVMIGEGIEEKKLRDLIIHKGLGDSVLMLPFQPQPQLPYWYNLCDALVIPSRQEGRPNILLEALSCQRPILSTRLPGVLEVMPPEYSPLTCNPDDVSALCSLMEDFLKNPAPHQTFATMGPEILRAKELAWDIHAKKLMACYGEVATSKNL